MRTDNLSAASLHRIAEVLGVPVETFYAPPAAGTALGDLEMLFAAFTGLRSPEARARVVALAESEARRERAS